MKFVTLLLLGLVVINCDSVVEKLGSLAQGDFGFYVANLITLKVQQKNSFDQVVGMVQKLADDLVNSQTVADSDHASKTAQLSEKIENLEDTVENLNEEKAVTNRVILTLAEEIAGLTGTVATQQRQVATLSDQVNELNEQRNQGHAEYERRVQAYNRMLNAVITVQTKLTAAVLDREGTMLIESDRKVMVNSLKTELGAKHPVALLVEITARFDAKTALRVIDKLEQIAKQLTNSIQGEDERELQAHTVYQTTSGQLTTTFEAISKEFNYNNKILTTKHNDLVVAQRRASEITDELSNAEELIVATRNQLSVTHANYQASTNNRAEELQIVTQARDILLNNKESFQ